MSDISPAELQKRAEELRKLSATSIHTLNNMMFVISGYTHLLKGQIQDSQMLEQIDSIENGVNQARETMVKWKQESERLFPEADLPEDLGTGE